MKRIILFCLILIILLIPISIYAEEDLSISNWAVNSRLLEDGSLVVFEDITFNFKDKFNGVYRYIVLDGTDGISDIELYEVQGDKEISYLLDENAKKGTSNVYTRELDKSGVNIKIFSPSKDEEKTFRLKYTLFNVSTNQNDIGEFYYKYIGGENETPIEKFSAILYLPRLEKDKVKIIAHGPSNGTINYHNNDSIKLQVDGITPKTFVEARVLYPKDYTSYSKKNGTKNLSEIIQEEQNFANAIIEKQEMKLRTKDLLNTISLVLTGVGLILTWFISRLFRRDPGIYDTMNSLNPKDISPAELNLFMNQAINSRGLMASIFDLARREYLSIDEQNNEIKGKRTLSRTNYILKKQNHSNSNLLEHEKYLLDWLFNEIGNGHQVTTIEIDILRSKKPMVFSKGYNEWMKLVQKQLVRREYEDKRAKKIGGFIILLGILLFVPAVITLIFEGLYGIALIGFSIFLFVYGLILLYRKSDEGFIQYGLWKDFKKEIENLRDIDMGIPKDLSLIYALALGLNMKNLDSYRRISGNEYYPVFWGYWYFLYNNKGGSVFEDNFNKSFYGAIGSTSATSSTFGGGGGFSGGGGGGVGGGGAGGF